MDCTIYAIAASFRPLPSKGLSGDYRNAAVAIAIGDASKAVKTTVSGLKVLGMSTAAALLLWFIRAVVLIIAERKHQWFYLVSPYFSYLLKKTLYIHISKMGRLTAKKMNRSNRPRSLRKFFTFSAYIATSQIEAVVRVRSPRCGNLQSSLYKKHIQREMQEN